MFKTLLNEKEKKVFVVFMVIVAIVFAAGYVTTNTFLKEDGEETASTMYACEEYSGLPFEIEGVETKEAFAILQNANSEAYVNINVKGRSEDLTLTFDSDICYRDYQMNEEGTSVESFMSVKVQVYFEDGTSEEHTVFKGGENDSIVFYDFPEGVISIALISKQPITGHTFFDSSEYEEAHRYELIKDIYINFD